MPLWEHLFFLVLVLMVPRPRLVRFKVLQPAELAVANCAPVLAVGVGVKFFAWIFSRPRPKIADRVLAPVPVKKVLSIPLGPLMSCVLDQEPPGLCEAKHIEDFVELVGLLGRVVVVDAVGAVD